MHPKSYITELVAKGELEYCHSEILNKDKGYVCILSVKIYDTFNIESKIYFNKRDCEKEVYDILASKLSTKSICIIDKSENVFYEINDEKCISFTLNDKVEIAYLIGILNSNKLFDKIYVFSNTEYVARLAMINSKVVR